MKVKKKKLKSNNASNKKYQKMSEMVLKFAQSYIDMGETTEERQNYLNSACSAWNISLLPVKKRIKAIKKYLKEYKKYNPDVDDEDCKDMQDNIEKLISEKEKLFPDENRRIVRAEIEVKNGKEHVNVLFLKGI
jgi:hypothetical protein